MGLFGSPSPCYCAVASNPPQPGGKRTSALSRGVPIVTVALKKADQSYDSVVMPTRDSEAVELSVVMPCLNEAETLETCIRQAQRALRDANIVGEIIVADNGSSDGSQEIAERLGARVVQVEARGYGNALMGGIAFASGKYILMGDADDSYDFGHIPRFVERLRQGADLVMGNRFRGGIERRAMPPLHRYLGNPVLTEIGRLLFKSPCGDFHCGLRAFTKGAYARMGLRTTGMEFASEMVVKAALFNMAISEVATSLRPDGRSRAPHLRTWRDGWRHLRFLLLYSPRWLFLYPGLALMFIGVIFSILLLPGPVMIANGVGLDVHTLLVAGMAILVGVQSITFGFIARMYAIKNGILPPSVRYKK